MSNRWKIALIALVMLAITISGLSLVTISSGNKVEATTLLDASAVDVTDFARAIAPYNWQFPEDFGPHPDFQTEWWYYTGNIATDEGRRFGYQFTIFRRAITPDENATDSEWRTNQIYLAHFTVANIGDDQFWHEQRLSRGSAGLAGATIDPRYRVWVEEWEIAAQNDDAAVVTIQAATPDFAIDLTLEQTKPPALQGDKGLSAKSSEEGNASYYYSLSRLATTGTITVEGESYAVNGISWKDHEFSTSALGTDAEGWDWFGLIFDNDTEVMLGQIRMVDGDTEPAFGGIFVYPDGSTEYLAADAFSIAATDTWVSPHSGAEYPSGWDITIQTQEGVIAFHAEPLMRDQELADTNPSYWEGAVHITGDVTGYGYAELTGYTTTMQNRF
jgi:predicted secreted hydrolase